MRNLFQLTDLSLYSYMVEVVKDLCGVSSLRSSTSFIRVPPLWPKHLPKASLSMLLYQILILWHINFEGTHIYKPQHQENSISNEDAYTETAVKSPWRCRPTKSQILQACHPCLLDFPGSFCFTIPLGSSSASQCGCQHYGQILIGLLNFRDQ